MAIISFTFDANYVRCKKKNTRTFMKFNKKIFFTKFW